MFKKIFSLLGAMGAGLFATAAQAELIGRSNPWQLWFQKPMSPTAEKVFDFNIFLFWIEGFIVVFVLGLMAYIVIKFNAKANPVPSKTTHNTLLEVVWTGLPILILIGIAVPSLKLLYYADKTEEYELTLKVIGNQWYWSYEYPDHGNIAFDSVLIEEEDLKPGQPRLLSVDNPAVLPANTKIRLLYSSNDVIHNWAVPSLSLKMDNTPGRVNETWIEINQPGDFYGMCSELCGVNHGYMPIHVKAIPKEEFAAWVEKAKKEFASDDSGETEEQKLRLAKADAAAR